MIFLFQTECHWYCEQANFTVLPDNIFSDQRSREALFKPVGNEIAKECPCNNLLDKDRPAEYFLHVPLEYQEQFDEKVNLNLSIAKFATNVWQRGKFQLLNSFILLCHCDDTEVHYVNP